MKRQFLIPVALLLLATSAFAQPQVSTSKRTRVIDALRDCTRRYPKADCETPVDRAITQYKRGDKAVLKPLMDLGMKSDGFLSEMLGVFFGEDVLSKSPRLFLNALATRSRKQQDHLAFLAGAMDGGGMPKEMLRNVRAKLLSISKLQHDRLAPIAKVCLSSVLEANKNQ